MRNDNVTLQTEQPSIAWSWLKSISRDLYALDEIPLLGMAPDFPWERLTQEFTQVFGLQNFSIKAGELAWKEKEAVTAKVGPPVLCTEITATGMQGSCIFRILREDVEHFMAKVLQISEVESELQAEDVVTNFYRFLSIEAISLLNKIGYDPRISFKITSYEEKVPDAALCQDVEIALGQEKCLARLIIQKEFADSWRSLFMQSAVQQANLSEIETEIHLELGRTEVPLEDILKIRAGDFLLFDKFYGEEILITLHGRALFKASRDPAGLKILELFPQSEAFTPMEENVSEAAKSFPETAPESIPVHEDENPFPDEEEDDDHDAGLELVEAAAKAPLGAAPQPKAEAKGVSVAKKPEPKSDKLTANDIPVQLIIEVATVNLSVQKLLELTPGNLLDLNLSPESGVNLVVNERIVGKGELVKIGETIGVRILQIGV